MNVYARCRVRSIAAFLMAICLLAAPITTLAKKGEKNYRRGIQYETAQQWEKAAQEFALAVAASPSDIEYQLHYRRAIFNASQTFMQQGRALAEGGDYIGAYNAFRQAYGYDSVNELALNEMQRMLRLQREKEGLPPEEDAGKGNGVGGSGQVTPTSFQMNGAGGNGSSAAARGSSAQVETLPPTRAEQLRVITYSGDLEAFVRNLAEQLTLNVVFDRDFPRRTININWRDVTTAQALDYLFTAQGLFFQRLSRRTILVADQSKRPQYQQLVLRTFYLSNLDPNDARTYIQTAVPAQPGRQPQVIANKATNSITVRDTPENIRLIGELLQTIDKDRAEVVMDVSIYEVQRTDLLQLGIQLGTATTLTNLGGTSGLSIIGGSREVAQQAFPLTTALGAAFAIPASTISALQSKDNTRLVFSTQVHAFDGEKSETRIGAKVPVQTANVSPFGGFAQTSGGQTAPGVNQGAFGGTGFPVIQYEDTGLSLDFTPQVFSNQDVQVKMVIETKDASSSGNTLTPTFTQRRITGTARIPNNKTMLIASIAQDRQADGRVGLPVLGLVPVLGRFFSTPKRNNTQSDVVITVTPRVLRAPNVGPRDEVIRPGGSLMTPLNDTLEAMLRQADREDQLAAARQLPTNVTAQLPAPAVSTPETDAATYVPAPKVLMDGAKATDTETANAAVGANKQALQPASLISATSAVPQAAFVTTTTQPKSASPDPAAAGEEKPPIEKKEAAISTNAAVAPPEVSIAELRLMSEQEELRVGEKRWLMLMLKTDAPLGLAAATLRFDPRIATVRSVSKGALFGGDGTGGAAPTITQSVDPKGILLISVAPAAGAPPLTGQGILLLIEIEAIAAGESAFTFDTDKVHLIATDGRTIHTQVMQGLLKVKP